MVRDLSETNNRLVLEVCGDSEPNKPAYLSYGQPLLEAHGRPHGVRVMENGRYGIMLVGRDNRTGKLGVLVVPHSHRTYHAVKLA
jgi:hypothetical protein